MGANEMEATTTSKPPRISTLFGKNSSLPDADNIVSGKVNMFSNIRALQNITTRHKRQRGNFETPIGTEDAISINSGFKRLENKLDCFLSEDQVITSNTGEKDINHALSNPSTRHRPSSCKHYSGKI